MKYRYLFTFQNGKNDIQSEVVEYDEKPSHWILDEDFKEWFNDMLSFQGIEGYYEEL